MAVGEPELSDLEDRLLCFFAWIDNQDERFVPVFMNCSEDEIEAATTRLAELGMIGPAGLKVN